MHLDVFLFGHQPSEFTGEHQWTLSLAIFQNKSFSDHLTVSEIGISMITQILITLLFKFHKDIDIDMQCACLVFGYNHTSCCYMHHAALTRKSYISKYFAKTNNKR